VDGTLLYRYRRTTAGEGPSFTFHLSDTSIHPFQDVQKTLFASGGKANQVSRPPIESAQMRKSVAGKFRKNKTESSPRPNKRQRQSLSTHRNIDWANNRKVFASIKSASCWGKTTPFPDHDIGRRRPSRLPTIRTLLP
jgi:hypothetical protein